MENLPFNPAAGLEGPPEVNHSKRIIGHQEQVSEPGRPERKPPESPVMRFPRCLLLAGSNSALP